MGWVRLHGDARILAVGIGDQQLVALRSGGAPVHGDVGDPRGKGAAHAGQLLEYRGRRPDAHRCAPRPAARSPIHLQLHLTGQHVHQFEVAA